MTPEELVLADKVISAYLQYNFISIPGYELEDLKQECRILVWENWHKFDPAKSKPSSWIQMILWARLCTILKTAAQRELPIIPDFEFEFLPDDSPSTEASYIKSARKTELQKCLSKHLTEIEFSVFELYLKDLEMSEIAARLGTSGKSVDNALCRIRGKIKQRSEDIREIMA